MSTSTFWDQVRALEGSTVHSIARNKAYDVVDVSGDVIVLHIRDGGKTRKLKREDLEFFYNKLVREGQLSIEDLKTVYVINISTAASILAALPEVTATSRPIHLYYGRR